jgi:hypothetical protein
MSDTAIVYSGATGLPAALKDAYFTLYSSPVGNYIYKYHLMALEGTLEIPNNTTDLGSQLGQSLLTYIPYVDTLDFSDCTYLTGTLDVSGCTRLVELNTSNTSLNVDFGTGSSITVIHLGNPASIILKNPTAITPNGITVDGYANLESLDIRNIPGAKTYNAFDKITLHYNSVIRYKSISNGVITDSSSRYDAITYNLPVTNGHSIYCESTASGGSLFVNLYEQDGTWISPHKYIDHGSSTTFTVPSNASYIVAKFVLDGSFMIKDTTANKILFKYTANEITA